MIQEIDGKKRARLIGSHDSFLLSGSDFVHFGTSLQDVLWKDIIGGISPLKTNVLRKILLGVILVFLPTLSNAQDAKVSLCLKDSLGQSIDWTSCSVFNAKKNVLVLSSWSNENGEVSFLLSSDDSYILKVSHMGSLLKELHFNIPKGVDKLELGTLYLSMNSVLLDEAVVQGKRVSRKANNIKVNIKGSSLENIGTTMDVLREIPRVVIQGDEISILGKGTPSIYLNGRKVLNIDEILNIKSSEIKTIEVLGNPNGRYGVNASSAIVITTSTSSKDIWGIDLMDKVGSKGKFLNALNVTAYLNLPKLSIKVGTNHVYGEKMYHKEDTYDYSVLGNQISNRSITELSDVQKNLSLSTEVVYHINDNHSIYLLANLDPTTHGKEYLDGLLHHNDMNNGYTVQEFNSTTQTNSSNALLSGAYHFNTTKTKIDFSGTYFYLNQNANRYLSTEQEDSNFDQKSIAHNLTLKGDCEQNLSKVFSLFSGIEYVFTQRDGKYKTTNSNTDFFRQKQLIGYVALQANINKRWRAQAQMGMEFIDFKYFKNETIINEQSKRSLKYLPKLSVSYENEDFSLELSYNKTIDKPSYNQLSSNSFMSNKYLRWDGNPTLRNSYVHSLTTDLTYGWANLSLSYSRVKDGFFEVCTLLDPQSMIVKISPENLPDYNQFYAGLSMNPQIRNLGILADVGLQLQDLKYGGVSYNKPLIAYSFRLNYTFPKGVSLRCGISGHLKNGSYATGETKGYSNFDIRLSKSWISGKLITQIYATDIFNKAYERILLNTNNILRQDYSHGGTRGIFLIVQYKFGKSKKSSGQTLSKEMMRLMP